MSLPGFMVNGRDVYGNYDIILFFSCCDPFSNFFLSPFRIQEGITFNTVEQYFQYKKAEHFNDRKNMKLILKAKTPKKQKYYGQRITNFNQREWEPLSLKVMKKALLYKFNQNPDLKKILINTKGYILAEASRYDRKWGTGYQKNHKHAFNMDRWGENLLGRILMRIRDKFLWDEECEDRSKICHYMKKTIKGKNF